MGGSIISYISLDFYLCLVSNEKGVWQLCAMILNQEVLGVLQDVAQQTIIIHLKNTDISCVSHHIQNMHSGIMPIDAYWFEGF